MCAAKTALLKLNLVYNHVILDHDTAFHAHRITTSLVGFELAGATIVAS